MFGLQVLRVLGKPSGLAMFALAALSIEAVAQDNVDDLRPIGTVTLTEGAYPETFKNDTLRWVGNALFNTRLGRVVAVRDGVQVQRFGYQGQEKDEEVHGATGTSYSYEHRMHDLRVGRFLSIDPLAAKYPHNSPYAFSENRVIDGVELEGLEAVDFRERQTDGVTHQIDIDKNGILDGALRTTSSVANTTFSRQGTPSTQQGAAVPGVSPGVQSVLNAANSGNPNMSQGVGATVRAATTGNPPPGGSGLRAGLMVRNQFDQSFGIQSGIVGTPAPNIPPTVVPQVSTAINGTNPLSQVLANNTSRVLLIVNGSAPSIAQANADVVALQTAFPSINFSVAAIPTHPQFNTPGLGAANGNVVVALNPTQNYLTTRGVNAGNTLVPFTGSRVPAPAPPAGFLPISFPP